MQIEKRTRQVEKIEKQGKPDILGIKTCKTYRKALQTLIGQYYKKGNHELEFHTRGLLELYNKFHPEQIGVGEIKGWKGKSGIINIQKLPDKVIITRVQRPAKGEEPKEVNIEIERFHLEAILKVLSKLTIGETIDTKYLAMAYSNILELGHKKWKDFFADRKNHNLLTNILGFLDTEEFIVYKGGKTTRLDNKLSIQILLP